MTLAKISPYCILNNHIVFYDHIVSFTILNCTKIEGRVNIILKWALKFGAQKKKQLKLKAREK